jgi:hypothetical protein
MRRFVAIALALSLLSASLGGCSQPIDTGSSVPAQSQPFVALLALVGLGIGLTAWHHHNEHHSSGGGGPTIFGAQFLVPPFISGFAPVDLAVDPANIAVGAIELPTAGGGTGKFTEIQNQSGGGVPFGTETLQLGYVPTSVAIDPSGVTWFVNASGLVEECDILTSTTTTCNSSLGPFNDGLGAGSRSIAADGNFVFVILDAGGGKVKWWVESLTSSPPTATGTYTSNSTAAIFPGDAVKSTPSGGFSDFTVYHQDGTSDNVTFTVSGSTLTLNAQPNMSFNPVPAVAPSNFGVDLNSKDAFYAFSGSPTGSYDLTKYESTSVVGLGNPTATSELIRFNGQEGNASAIFTPPLTSVHFDTAEGTVWALDHAGNIVAFAQF